MSVAIIGCPSNDAAADKWIRQALGLHDWATMDFHLRTDNGHSVIVVGRDEAERHGMQRFGIANHVPLAGHQWRKGGTLYTFAPSPSALATLPDGPAARASLRRILMAEMVLGCPTLRPWHFRLQDQQTLHDLGVAWCPASPVAGMAFALWSAEAHRQRAATHASPLSQAVHAAFPSTSAHVAVPAWDAPMRGTFHGRVHEETNPASIVAAMWGTTRAAVEAFLPHCPTLTAHDAARGILVRHMMEFAT